VKTNIGGNLIVYELPATLLPVIPPMSAVEEKAGSGGGSYVMAINDSCSQQSTPVHVHHHGDQQQQQQQQWGLGQIQRSFTSEYQCLYVLYSYMGLHL